MANFPVTIFHNPACGTSRNTLAALREQGYEPEVVEYLKVGWTRAELEALLKAMGGKPRDIMRTKGGLAAELGLENSAAGDDDILQAMVQNPALVERPIVRTPKGVKLCRPSEKVFQLLERAPEVFTKEDGQQVTVQK